MPCAPTLLARSQLLEGAGGPYFGSVRAYDPSLTSAIKRIIKRILGYAYRIFQKIFVFELQWILLIFASWPSQEPGFGASDRNKDSSNASTARKLTLDAIHTTLVTPFLARPSPNRFFENKTERGGEEREKRKGRERRKRKDAPANSPPIMARV